jgi:acyl-CoA reductase-like NAD-dependent aldehyde dehydrogenase
MSTPEEAQQAVRDLRSSARVWSSKTVEERVEVLRKFQELLLDSLDEITAVLNKDSGKSRQDALIELLLTVDMLQQNLKQAPRWLKRRKVSTGLYFFKRAYVDLRPYGVVLVISPWNYPLALSLPPVLAALLAGNTVLLKPSEVTGATGVLMARLFQRLPELSPYVRVLHGDGAVGAAAVKARPDYIFLTGSTQTGRKVMQAAAADLIPMACHDRPGRCGCAPGCPLGLLGSFLQHRADLHGGRARLCGRAAVRAVRARGGRSYPQAESWLF